MLSSYLLATIMSLSLPSEEPQVRADVPNFGQRGQLVLRGTTAANVYGNHMQLKVAGTTLKNDSVAFSIEPSAGVFIVDNLLLGGVLDVDYSFASGDYAVNAGAGPYLGYRIAMSHTTSFLPAVAVAYGFSRSHLKGSDDNQAQDLDGHHIVVRVNADFVFNIAPRVSLTAGPFVTQSVYTHMQGGNSPVSTTYGLRAGVLSWL